MKQTYITNSEEQTQQLAATFAKSLLPGDVIAMFGGMGMGKTCFVRGLAQGLGLTGEVSSPTFAIVNEYFGPTPLYHFDMYRVQSGDDLETTGYFDYLYAGRGIMAIEWSENIVEDLPPHRYNVCFSGQQNTRTITIQREDTP